MQSSGLYFCNMPSTQAFLHSLASRLLSRDPHNLFSYRQYFSRLFTGDRPPSPRKNLVIISKT